MSRTNSTVVDSKVVEMSLDNRNFEQNATISMQTLKELKKALDFSTSNDGIDNVGKSVKKVKFDSLLSGIEQAKNGFSALEAVAFGAFANIGKKISDVALKIGTAIPNAIIEGGKNRALKLEQARFQMEGLAKAGLGHGWTDAVDVEVTKLTEKEQELKRLGEFVESVSADVDYAVAGTAFSLDQAASVASQLMASSVSVGDDMRNALRGISGMAAQTGSSYEEIGHIFTTVAGNGRLMGMQLTQLSTKGVNVAATLGKALGKTEAEIREMVHKGEIDFQTFANAMDEAYGENATKANDTFAGSLTNVRANLARIGEMFASPVFDNLRKIFASMIPIIKELKVRLTPLADAFTNVANKIGDGISGALDAVYAALTGQPLKEITKSATDGVEAAVGEMENIRKTAIEVIRGDWANGQERINRLTEAGFDASQVQAYVNKVHELTGGTWDLNDAILAQADAYFGDFVALSQLSDEELLAAGMDQDAINTLRESAKALADNAEAAEDVGANVANMDNKTKFLYALTNTFGGFRDIFNDVGDVFRNKFANLTKGDFSPISFFLDKFVSLSTSFKKFAKDHGVDVAKIFGGIFDALMLAGGAFRTVGQAVWTFVSSILKPFGTNIIEFAGWIGTLVSRFHSWVVENEFAKKALDWLGDTVEGVVGKIKGFFDIFTKNKDFNNGLIKIRNGVRRTFKQMPQHFESTKKAFSDFVQRVKGLGGINFKNIGQVFLDFKDNVLGQFLDFKPFQRIQEGVIQVTTVIRDAFEGLSYDAEGNETIFGKVYHAIASGFEWIGTKADEAKQKFLDWYETYDIGTFLDKQILNFKMGFEQLFDHSLAFIKGLPAVFMDFFKQVQESGGFSFDNLGNIFEIFKNTVIEYFKDFHGFDGLSAAFDVFKQDLHAKILEIFPDFDNWVNKIIEWKDKIVATIMSIPEAISNFSLPDAIQSLIDFVMGKSGDQTVVSSSSKIVMGSPLATAFGILSVDAAEEMGDSADSMDKSIHGFFGKTLGQYLPGIAGGIIKVLGNIGDTLLLVWDKLIEGFKGLEPGWIIKLVGAILMFKGLNVLGTIAGGVSKFMKALAGTEKAKAKDIRANAMLKTAAAIGIVALAIAGLAQLKVGQIMQGAGIVVLIVGAMVGINAALERLAPNASQSSGGLLGMAGSIAIIAGLSLVLSLIDWEFIWQGLVKVIKIAAVLAGVTLAFRIINPPDMSGVLALTESIAMLAGIAFALGFVPWKTFESGLKKLGIVIGILVGTLAAISLINRFIGPVEGIIEGLSSLLISMVGSLVVLSFLPAKQMEKGVNGLGKIMLMLIGLCAAIGAINRFLGDVRASVGSISILVGVMTAAIIGLSFIKPKKLEGAVEAMKTMAEVIAAVTAAVAVMGKMPKGAGLSASMNFLGFIGPITAVVTAVIALLAVLDNLPGLKGGISGEGGALDMMGNVLAKLGEVIGRFVGGLASGALKQISAVDQADLDKITNFISSIANIQIPTQTEFKWDENGMSFVDQSMKSFASGMKGIVGAINDLKFDEFTKENLDEKIEYMTAIGTFTSDLAGIDIPVQTITTKAGLFQEHKVDQSLEKFAKGMKGVVTAVNMIYLDEDVTDEYLNKRYEYMNRIAGFTEKLAGIEISTQTAETIKTNSDGVEEYSKTDNSLEKFAKGMQGIVDAVNYLDIDGGSLLTLAVKAAYFNYIADFTKKLAAISIPVQTIKTKVGNWFEGSETTVDKSLEKFGQGMKKVVEAVNTIEVNPLDFLMLPLKVSYLNMIAGFTEKLAGIEIPTQYSASWSIFEGNVEDSSLYSFAVGMSAVGSALNEMEKPTVTVNDVERMAQCVAAMAKAAKHIPTFKTGISKWFNDNSLSGFATQMKNSAPDIVAASKEASGADVANVTKVAECVGAMIGAIQAMDPGNEEWDGTNWVANLESISDYAEMVGKIGKAFASFSGIQKYSVEDIEKIPDLLAALGKVNDELKNLQGEGALDDGSLFASNIQDAMFGVGMAVDGAPDQANTSAVVNAINVLNDLDISSGDIYDAAKFETFKTNLDVLVSTISSLTSVDTSGVDKVSSAAEKLNTTKLADTATDDAKKGLAKAASAVEKDSSVSKAFGNVISSGASAITAQSGSFTSAGRSLVSALVAGITAFRGTVKTAFSRAVNNGLNAAKEAVASARSLGIDFASGYANGISFNTPFVANAARQMVKRAKESVRSEQNSSSPSKETYKLGRYFIDGYANAIKDFSSDPSEAAREMARATIDSVSESLAMAASMIEEDQYQPAITPILDLTEIQNRASGIESLLNTSPMVRTNLGAVSFNSSMSRMRTTNDDVVEALQELGGIMGTIEGGNTYNVNGVTYDDGSNIASAVGEIVRAARVERRA